MIFINERDTPYIFYTPMFVILHPIFLFSSLKYHIEVYIILNQRNIFVQSEEYINP